MEWITETKREETRQARMKTALEWLAQGKAKNWKYMKTTGGAVLKKRQGLLVVATGGRKFSAEKAVRLS